MTISELKNNPDYIHHHTASRRGYVSRKYEGIVKPYSGKFGVGYVVMLPRWDTTNYCYIQYYIKESKQK